MSKKERKKFKRESRLKASIKKKPEPEKTKTPIYNEKEIHASPEVKSTMQTQS